MPIEQIKCSGAVRTYTWKGSGHGVSSGMFKDIFADFFLLRLWSAGGQRRLIPLIGRGRHEKLVLQKLKQLYTEGFSCWVSQGAEREHKAPHMSGFPQN